MFFSNLSLLNIDDEIYLYDTDNKKYIYKIFKTYEVVPSDLSPVFEFEYNSKELTLITCINLNSNRFIVKSIFVFDLLLLLEFSVVPEFELDHAVELYCCTDANGFFFPGTYSCIFL